MPPKKSKVAETRSEEEVERELVEPYLDIASPTSLASTLSSRSCGSVTSEQLSLILEANQKAMHQSMTALLATLSPSVAAASGTPRMAHIEIPKFSDDDIPSEYFIKFEKALLHNGIEKGTWGQLLPVYLSGRAQAAFAQVDPDSLDNYEVVKKTLLESLGDTPASADRKWWTLNRMSNEDPGAFYLRIRAIGLRRLHGLANKEEVIEKTILSRFLSLLHPDCYSNVASKEPKNGLEAARMVQEYEETRSFQRRRQPWKQDSSYHHKRDHGYQNNGGSSRGGVNRAPPKEGVSNPNPSSSGHSDQIKPKGERTRKPITCFGCGEEGHIRPNCPNKIRRVKSPECDNKGSMETVDGWLAGTAVSGLRIDTGADRTIVSSKFVPASAYIKKTVILDSWTGKQFSKHQVAKICIKVGSTKVEAEVAVSDTLDFPALLGVDLGNEMKVQLLSIIIQRAQEPQAKKTEQPVASVRLTRAQTKAIEKDDIDEQIAFEESEAEPVPLEDIFDFPDAYFEQDPIPTPLDECAILDEVGQVDIPLPNLEGSDSNSLITEQQNDTTLKNLLKLAVAGEKGYCFEKGVLVQSTSDGLGDCRLRIVVPIGRRQNVLELAHSSCVAGHFGVKKTFAKISCKFLWPKMWTQVQSYVKTCVGCQRASRKDKGKAPLQPLQCMEEPFQKVAFDLVGPLPKSQSGYRYILTAMCLYTKFPSAIPLKRVDNHSVLEAMFEIFSTFGLPEELLTDQGSVFTSKLTKAMCESFGIHKLQMSPYHPQSDGALERWHACLKGMLKRSQCDIKNWDKQLKYILFAYRSAPHCVTGFSPFTLMYGREVKGPLDVLQESWLSSGCENVNVGEWLVAVKAKMAELSSIVSDRERAAKAKMKMYHDRTAKAKNFEAGEMVLVRKPGIHSKMGASWAGPFQVERKISPVTYKIQVPGKPSQSKVLHSNLLKKWSTTASRVHRIAIIHEEEGEEEKPSGLKLNRENFEPSEDQQAVLESVLDSFSDVINSEPGRTDKVKLSINTGTNEPVRSHPYRIPPRWHDEVKVQVDSLLRLGIIRPSTSPWASSVVTVKKKEGGVRICVDYRAVNELTLPDPYLMLLIEEILDTLAAAKFMSKIDLNKGFHQIPVNNDDIAKTAFCTP